MGVVDAQIAQLSATVNGTQVFTDAAFENYGIANGKAVRQATALDVAGAIAKQGVGAWGMIFSTDIGDMRACWADTAGFIDSLKTVRCQGR